MGHVTRHMFKRCKQSAREIYIFFIFCFCSIIFYSYPSVPFLFNFIENRTVPLKLSTVDICLNIQIKNSQGLKEFIEKTMPGFNNLSSV